MLSEGRIVYYTISARYNGQILVTAAPLSSPPLYLIIQMLSHLDFYFLKVFTISWDIRIQKRSIFSIADISGISPYHIIANTLFCRQYCILIESIERHFILSINAILSYSELKVLWMRN